MKNLTVSSPNLPPLANRFRLGEWIVEPSLNHLTHRSGVDIQRSLEPRLMHLLCVLAANAPRVVSREDLIQELWPRVVVNENSLTRAVSELRKQLAIPGKPGSACLQTISKRGYRLTVTPVEVDSAPAETGWTPTLASVIRRPAAWVASAGLSLALALSLWLPGGEPAQPAVVSQDDTVYDRVIETGYSPSGRLLTLTTLDLLDQPAVETPVLSPDGSALAFVRHDSKGSSIYLGSGEAMDSPVLLYSSQDAIGRLSWSPVGHALLFARRPFNPGATPLGSPPPPADLMMLDLDTLEVRLLLEQPATSTPASGKSNLT